MYKSKIWIYESEELFLSNYADLTGFFDGEYEKPSHWESLIQKIGEHSDGEQRNLNKESDVRKKLGLEKT